MSRPRRASGFTVIEVLTALAIAAVVAAMTLPPMSRALADVRIQSDARAIHRLISSTLMTAAAKYTRTRVVADLGAGTLRAQRLDRVSNVWVDDGDVVALSSSVHFGTSTLQEPPPSTQTTLAQSPACLNDAHTPIADTACILFNSRGIPIDGAGSPVGGSALYITNGVQVFGVTLSATPLVRLWSSPAYVARWTQRP